MRRKESETARIVSSHGVTVLEGDERRRTRNGIKCHKREEEEGFVYGRSLTITLLNPSMNDTKLYFFFVITNAGPSPMPENPLAEQTSCLDSLFLDRMATSSRPLAHFFAAWSRFEQKAVLAEYINFLCGLELLHKKIVFKSMLVGLSA